MSAKPRITAADRRARNRLVLEARSAGRSWEEIAERFRLSERHARRAAASAARLAAEAGLSDIDAGRVLEDIVRAQCRALYRLEELVFDGQPNIAVGAAKACGTVGEALRNSLVSAGLIPSRTDEIWLRREMQEAARAMLRVAETVGIPEDRLVEEVNREPALAGRIGG